jgi:hypothetical protein
MSVNVGPATDERFAWPNATPRELALAATRIARHVARSGARTVGLLPVDGDPAHPEQCAPLLLRIAEGLIGFVTGEVAIVDAWRTWPWGDTEDLVKFGDPGAPIVRPVAPRVVSLSPLPCHDALAAVIALQQALASRPADVAVTLVNLAGYALPGTVPPAAQHVDRVVLLVTARRTRQAAVAGLADKLSGRVLGAVLLG